jgi:hypothetical protein
VDRRIAQAAISTACAYEIAAIITKKVPTISYLCRKHRWAEVLLLSWLMVHLHRRREDLLIEETRRRHVQART